MDNPINLNQQPTQLSFWEEYTINTAFSTVLLILSQKGKATQFKVVLLKIRNKINEVFPGE